MKGNRGWLVSVVFFSFVLCTCNNFFHDLIPQNGDRIVSFYIPGQTGVVIGDDTITVIVPPGMALDRLVPSVRVSPGATLFPVTYEYISRTFGDDRTYGAAMEIYASGNMAESVKGLIRESRVFVEPVLDLPINFGYEVDFLVISAIGTIRQYKVRAEEGGGKFTSFRFDKFFNPDLVRGAVGSVDPAAKTVTVDVYYPEENIASYKLIPSFETNGARVYLDGRELRSDASLMDFLKPPDSSDLNNPVYARQTLRLTLKQPGVNTDWTLIVNFIEDPDTSRAIIDFRFTKARNYLISADYMADIIVNTGGDTGTVSVTVYYSGAKPESLRANFVSPGTVRVNGEIQSSGYSEHDFSSPLQYVVTSRDGSRVRTYTVTVTLVPASDPLPQITYFGFSQSNNPQLSSNSSAMIDHTGRLIIIEAAYNGDLPPYTLRPDFSASGNVTVNGVTQTGGVSAVTFSSPVGYTVTNPSNPTLKREYRVEVRFVKNLSSVAEISEFVFYRADNPGLIADTKAVIDPVTSAISATLLFDTPGGSRTLVPRWSAQGRVEAGGAVQTSGTGRQFYTPQIYNVSADSGMRRTYTVTIKEVNSRIYVRENATGLGNGTNWQNAYRNLQEACNDAALFPDYIPKEIWIAKGTYRPSGTGNIEEYFLITANTDYIGGFAGNETAKSQRNVAANKVTISGDLGGGRLSMSLFATGFHNPTFPTSFSPITIDGGTISFENIDFTSCNGEERESRDSMTRYGGAISTGLSNGNVLKVSHCNFSNLVSYSGAAIMIYNSLYPSGTARDFHLEIDNIDVRDSGSGVSFSGGNRNSSLVIRDSEFQNIENSAIDAFNHGNISVENVNMENVKRGIDLSRGLNGATTRISDCRIITNTTTFSGSYAIYIYGEGEGVGDGDVELDRVTIDNLNAPVGKGVFLAVRNALISNCKINNTGNGSSYSVWTNQLTGQELYASDHGSGIILQCDTVTISNTVITNARLETPPWYSRTIPFLGYGGGIYWEHTRSLTIRDSRLENCTASYAGGAIYPTSGFTRINTQFINCSP